MRCLRISTTRCEIGQYKDMCIRNKSNLVYSNACVSSVIDIISQVQYNNVCSMNITLPL